MSTDPVLNSTICPTTHRLVLGDARNLSFIADCSVHLVLTSPPYWTLKKYNETPAQLGHIADYEEFLAEIGKVFAECHRVDGWSVWSEMYACHAERSGATW